MNWSVVPEKDIWVTDCTQNWVNVDVLLLFNIIYNWFGLEDSFSIAMRAVPELVR